MTKFQMKAPHLLRSGGGISLFLTLAGSGYPSSLVHLERDSATTTQYCRSCRGHDRACEGNRWQASFNLPVLFVVVFDSMFPAREGNALHLPCDTFVCCPSPWGIGFLINRLSTCALATLFLHSGMKTASCF